MIDLKNKRITWGYREWDFGELQESLAESGEELKQIFADAGDELKDICNEFVDELADIDRQRKEEGTFNFEGLTWWQVPLAVASAPFLVALTKGGAALSERRKNSAASGASSKKQSDESLSTKKQADESPSRKKQTDESPVKEESVKNLFVGLCKNIAATEQEKGIKLEPEYVQPRFNKYFKLVKESAR